MTIFTLQILILKFKYSLALIFFFFFIYRFECGSRTLVLQSQTPRDSYIDRIKLLVKTINRYNHKQNRGKNNKKNICKRSRIKFVL